METLKYILTDKKIIDTIPFNLIGVYTIIFENGDRYIGVSKHVGKRIRTHFSKLRKASKYNNKFKIDTIIIQVLDNYREAQSLEQIMIMETNPERNIKLYHEVQGIL